MQTNRLGRTLAAGVMAVAVFGTLAAISRPVHERRPSIALTVVVALVLGIHAALYWWGDELRARVGMPGYLAAQASAVFVVGSSGALLPVGIALYIALTAETVIIAGQRWGTLPITLGAIALFGTSAIVASDLYQGANAGLMLALTGVIAHAIGAVIQRRGTPEQGGAAPALGPASVAVADAPADPRVREIAGLTPRELEVLRSLTRGARTSEIASELGIAERTVKAHLASIYQKLGVETRAAAVAAAIHRGLT
jgi:DNA-binding CsgD family transcriptional regulator